MKNLKFPNTFPYTELEKEYLEMETTENLVELCFYWFEMAEFPWSSFKEAYYISALTLYSEITNLSYQSKICIKMTDRNTKLKKRVEAVRKELDDLGFKDQRNDFSLKYKEYVSNSSLKEKTSKKNRLTNLWYCKVFDESFTIKLEAFLTFKKTHYK